MASKQFISCQQYISEPEYAVELTDPICEGNCTHSKIKSTIHCRTFQYKVDSNVSSLSEYELCSRRKKCIKQRTWPEAMM